MNNYKCEVCGEEFDNVKVKANHVRWKHKSKDFYEKTKEKISLATNLSLTKKRGSIKQFTVTCNKCNKRFNISEREKDFPSKKKYFCSRKCANAHDVTDEHKEKTRRSIFQYLNKIGHTPSNKSTRVKVCPVCKKLFSSPRKYCSNTCVKNNKRKNLNEYRKYSIECRFQFSLNQYPNEFDFDLIRKHGWYSPKNHGNNPNGVTRDHIMSVRWAFENGIDSKYISHPANCQLMLQLDNIRKGKKKIYHN